MELPANPCSEPSWARRGVGSHRTNAQEHGEGGLSTLAHSKPLCRKIAVLSVPDLKRKPVASSTLSNANKICSPSSATIGRSDMIILSPILPVNILNRLKQLLCGISQIGLQPGAIEPVRLSNSLNNIRKCDNKNRRNICGAECGGQIRKPMNGTIA